MRSNLYNGKQIYSGIYVHSYNEHNSRTKSAWYDAEQNLLGGMESFFNERQQEIERRDYDKFKRLKGYTLYEYQ